MILQDSVNWIDSRQDSLVKQLMGLSEINSGTQNLAGLNKISTEFVSLFSPLADEVEVLESQPSDRVDIEGNAITEKFGSMLSFTKRASAPFRVLLCGHMDTVFPADHPFQAPERIDQKTMRGPGVADMKGGILVMLTALEAFEREQSDAKIGWQVILNADEETGSHGSSRILEAAAGTAHAGMIYEPALADGTLAGARKGSGNFTLIAHGRSAHAGREFTRGRNAINAMTKAIPKIADLTDIEKGITVNIARVSGGTALNVVPEQAVCQFNIRCLLLSDQAALAERLDTIVDELNQSEDCRFELTGKFSRPPKTLSPANQLFMKWAAECGQLMDIDVRFKDTGGCCDGNNLAAAGLPNIDTLGVRGGHIHTDQEFMLIDSLPERAKLSLLLLNKLEGEGDQLLQLTETNAR